MMVMKSNYWRGGLSGRGEGRDPEQNKTFNRPNGSQDQSDPLQIEKSRTTCSQTGMGISKLSPGGGRKKVNAGGGGDKVSRHALGRNLPLYRAATLAFVDSAKCLLDILVSLLEREPQYERACTHFNILQEFLDTSEHINGGFFASRDIFFGTRVNLWGKGDSRLH